MFFSITLHCKPENALALFANAASAPPELWPAVARRRAREAWWAGCWKGLLTWGQGNGPVGANGSVLAGCSASAGRTCGPHRPCSPCTTQRCPSACHTPHALQLGDHAGAARDPAAAVACLYRAHRGDSVRQPSHARGASSRRTNGHAVLQLCGSPSSWCSQGAHSLPATTLSTLLHPPAVLNVWRLCMQCTMQRRARRCQPSPLHPCPPTRFGEWHACGSCTPRCCRAAHVNHAVASWLQRACAAPHRTAPHRTAALCHQRGGPASRSRLISACAHTHM